MTGSAEARPNLGAPRTPRQEKPRIPDDHPGNPELAMQVRVPLVDNAPSFNDAIDRAAFILANDGWSIESVSHCALVGMDDQDCAFFQIVVTATRS
jgi:hypothetical protein